MHRSLLSSVYELVADAFRLFQKGAHDVSARHAPRREAASRRRGSEKRHRGAAAAAVRRRNLDGTESGGGAGSGDDGAADNGDEDAMPACEKSVDDVVACLVALTKSLGTDDPATLL
jgi:hypothetical protein